jgi:hypothetical protein
MKISFNSEKQIRKVFDIISYFSVGDTGTFCWILWCSASGSYCCTGTPKSHHKVIPG